MSLRAVPVLLFSLLLPLARCGDRSPPLLQELTITLNVNPSTPLVAPVLVRADEPVTVTFRIEGDGAEWNVDPGVDLASEHRIPLLGLRAGVDHRIVVVATDGAGNETTSDPIELRTDPLPEDFPSFLLKESDPERMEPGATLFNLMRWPEGGLDNEFGAVVIVDAQGEVIWYHLTDSNIGDASLLPNGHILYASGRRGRGFEVDMLGNVVAQWHSSSNPKEEMPEGSVEVDAETFHHEFLEMPSGNLLTLAPSCATTTSIHRAPSIRRLQGNSRASSGMSSSNSHATVECSEN